MLAHGIPRTDPFSAWGEGKPYQAYSWLFDVGAHLVFRGAGYLGLVLFTLVFAALMAAALQRLLDGSRVDFTRGACVLVLGLVALFRLVSPRPWLCTILFFTVELDVLLRYRRGGSARALLVLPPIFVLWANTHIQFVYGLFTLGLFLAEPVVNSLVARVLGDPADSPPARRVAIDRGAIPETNGTRVDSIDRRLLVLTGGCALATLANPYHVELWAVIAEYARGTGVGDLIDEHKAMGFRAVSDWAVLVVTLAAVAALGFRRETRPLPWLLLAAGVFFGFKAGRDVWYVAIPAAAILAGADRLEAPAPSDPFTASRGQALLAAFGVVAALALVGLARNVREPQLERELAGRYPVAACDHVLAKGLEGPLFNGYDWGDYLLFRLPHLKPSIDGRTNLQSDARLFGSKATWEGRAGWAKDPDLAGARLVIADGDAPLTELLRRDPAFAVSFEDARAVVFVRR